MTDLDNGGSTTADGRFRLTRPPGQVELGRLTGGELDDLIERRALGGDGGVSTSYW